MAQPKNVLAETTHSLVMFKVLKETTFLLTLLKTVQIAILYIPSNHLINLSSKSTFKKIEYLAYETTSVKEKYRSSIVQKSKCWLYWGALLLLV